MLDGIICDQEGRINNIGQTHAKLLKYDNDNGIMLKRIFAFFDKTTVLDVIRQWQTLEKTAHIKMTTLLRATDNTIFPANVSITKQDNINYLVKINPITDYNNFSPSKISFIKRIQMWLLISRANFLLATFVPLVFSIIWSLQYVAITNMPPVLLISLSIGTICCHIAANVFNDYFDWIGGADKINTNFIMSISGGSRAIEFGIINEKKLFILALTNLLIAALCALYISIIKGPLIIIISLIGAFAIYFYTAPPIRLAAKYGLGEVFIFLCFGPIFIAGAIYVLTNNISYETFFVGIPIGLLITSILLINEYPDLEADAKVKKINLAVVLGPRLLPFAVSLLIISSYFITSAGIIMHIFPKSYLLSMLTLPLAIYEIVIMCKMKRNRRFIQKACITNIKLYAAFGITFIIAGIVNLLGS